jgi:hypothetical protein
MTSPLDNAQALGLVEDQTDLETVHKVLPSGTAGSRISCIRRLLQSLGLPEAP